MNDAVVIAGFYSSPFKKIVYRMVNTRWIPSGEWMFDTILCIFY